jgi:peroxiredoxin
MKNINSEIWCYPRLSLMIIFFLANLVTIYNVSAQTPAKIIPDFTFFKEDKSPFTQKDLQTGTISFFVFFDITCEHCQSAIKQLNKQIGGLKNTTVYLITLDLPASVATFMNKYGKNLVGRNNVIQLYDIKNQFIVRFSPRKYPSLFLYTPQRSLMIYDDNPENLKLFFEKIKAYKSK